jgi:hypothetical protein
MKVALICFFDFVVSYNTGTIKVHATSANKKIVENLQDAYVVEPATSAKHVAFAKRNSEEGCLRVALLHTATSKQRVFIHVFIKLF